ncbi:MAG: DUF3737 family protein [Oscillospiraceae bacterium]|nr:DUF3737 family protein [Oscillospiraceae bacterium]
MTTLIREKRFDEERALYNLQDARLEKCDFSGPADGESVLKEARNIEVSDCTFSLRYPMWHVKTFLLENSSMDEQTRAPIWYAEDGTISRCKIYGVKAIKECKNIRLDDCDIRSDEFGWKSSEISMKDSRIESEYLFLDSRDVQLENVEMTGKYSFQYMENLTVENCKLDTKDAFWHSRNVTVRDCLVKGEYLAWFSDGLTLINCTISGTQPFCYCQNLKLVNCKMEDADLAFEYSDVDADIIGHVDSVKNPRSGVITLDSVGEIIKEAPVMPCTGQVVIR